ncbi:MAG: beta-ketoacyl-ACP synthase III [Chloroflexota bacterium]
MTRYARIAGWGKYVPEKVLTNHDLERMVETSDEWIRTRTGIRERRIAEEGETTCTMSLTASREALDVAGIEADDVDMIIVATSTPDYNLPAAANMVQDQLGARHAAAFDLRAGCTGFVYALAVGAQFIASGVYENVLVIGSEILSRFVDWEDRNTCVLFGDGAGAVVLRPSDVATGVLSFVLGSDGSDYDALIVPGGGSAMPFSQEVLDDRLHYLRMDGKRVFRFATRAIVKAVRMALEAGHLAAEDIDLIVPHQANERILQVACKNLKISEDKLIMNLDRYGNTSAASIPIALCEALADGRIQDGDNIVLVGFGAGLSWAAAVVRMGVPETIPQLVSWQFVPLKNETIASVKAALKAVGVAVTVVLGALSIPFFSSGRGKK